VGEGDCKRANLDGFLNRFSVPRGRGNQIQAVEKVEVSIVKQMEISHGREINKIIMYYYLFFQQDT
jgi:hypothetical protein